MNVTGLIDAVASHKICLDRIDRDVRENRESNNNNSSSSNSSNGSNSNGNSNSNSNSSSSSSSSSNITSSSGGGGGGDGGGGSSISKASEFDGRCSDRCPSISSFDRTTNNPLYSDIRSCDPPLGRREAVRKGPIG
ncbi:hypothetical protein V1478_007475 [Vespula squamosa]|uniref:Uncharacterized protein n=1 Tax=Vespula squamosa TaxID=30214 RepID=A0ABD2B381_VESSQ